MSFTIGSLFDGSGGFPLAATMCGGTPKWASEIEPYPIAVTKSRFPNMKHLGSITDIKGSEVEPVDVISFGSPCQDLSVAGKRTGLKHEANGDDETTRSGLFMEAIRIIKEMREATNGVYPRFALWENVPGAFSSNKGEDFRIVLEELIKIVEPTAVMPEVPKNGWPYADSYCGDGWSLAYRVLDAQFWGVPQRRRRIYLVADFRGQCAGKVSFEREGLRGYFETGRTPWQTVTGDAEGGSGATDCERDGVIAVDQGGGKSGANFHDNLSPTLTCPHGGEPVVAYSINHQGGNVEQIIEDKVGTLTAAMNSSGNNKLSVAYGLEPGIAGVEQVPYLLKIRSGCEGGGNVPMVMEPVIYDGSSVTSPINASNPQPGDPCHTLGTDGRNYVVEPVYCLQGNGIDRADTAGCNGKGVKEDVCYTLNTIDRPAVAYAMQSFGKYSESNRASAIKARDYKDATDLVVEESPICLDRAFFNQGQNAQYDPQFYQDGTVPTLVAKGPSAVCHKQEVRYIVRRLTPTECARLQGFPDNWGHPEWINEDVQGEEPEFWREVYMTDCAIKGKKPKPRIAEKQNGWEVAVIRWHNQLHTDSSEYKMWGNGIALPNALYVMQGIAEVMSEEKVARRKWLDDLLGNCL